MRISVRRPSPALVISCIALTVALGGTSYATVLQVPKNSVGPAQLKSAAVTNKKIANNAVRGIKIADGSVTGADISIDRLPMVPTARRANFAQDAATVAGHVIACPPATVLIRSICYDLIPHPVVDSVQVASDGCAARGGYLPTPLQLHSLRDTINLGSGAGTDSVYADAYYAYPGGGDYRSIAIDGKGAMTDIAWDDDYKYICAYPLVR